MKRLLVAAIGCVLVLSGTGTAQEGAEGIINAVAAALGAGMMHTVQFSGWGYDYVFGQAYDGSRSWPRFSLPGFTMTIDYAAPAMRDDRRRTQLEDPPLGGGFQPMYGEQRLIAVVNGAHAWDVVGDNAVIPGNRNDRQPNVVGRTDQIWLTPHGFVKLAMSSKATVRTETVRGTRKTIVSIAHPQYGAFEGTIDDRNLVERIERWWGHPVMGDAVLEVVFSDYRDVSGVKFPMKIRQRQGGYPLLDLTVTDVRINVPVRLDVPANIRNAPPAGPIVGTPEKLAEGVWSFPTYAKSVAIEFADHIAVVEAAETEAQSIEMIAKIRQAIPGKPIRYLINTHSHFDHIGGMRTYAAEGATIVTHYANVPYYQSLWASPRTLVPDRLAMSGREAKFDGVVGSKLLTDGRRHVFVYHYPGNMHNPGMLMVYLPKEKILVEADSFSPPPAPLTSPPNALVNLRHFVDYVDQLQLDVEQVVPIHGRVTTMDEARGILARFGTAN